MFLYLQIIITKTIYLLTEETNSAKSPLLGAVLKLIKVFK